MNAIGYCRISDKDQSLHSIPDQRRGITEFCTANNLNLIEIFEDKGESSYTFDRPDWKKVETFIKKNRSVDYLIIRDFDRFSRNLAEALMKIKELEDRFSVKIRSTTDRLDVDMTDPTNYLMRSFKLMIAESELMNIRKRTRAGIRQAAMNGYYTNVAPIGYKNIRTSDGRPTLEIDTDKAEFIKEIFNLHKTGQAPEQIRSILKAKGFNQRGNSQIQSIIANPIYAGMIKVPAFKDTPQYLTQGKHKAIIPAGDYWEAQGQKKMINIQCSDDVPLRGSLHCWCGKPMTAGNSKGRSKYYWYYLCTEHRKNFSAKKLHAQFEEILDNLSLSATDADWLKATITDKIADMLRTQGDDVTLLKAELSILKRQILSTEEKYLSNRNISEDSFNKKIIELRSRESFLEKDIKLKAATGKAYMDNLAILLPKLMNLREAYHKMDLQKKKQFIKTIFGDNLRYSDKSYRTAFINPFFSHNALKMKEKGLLIKDSPVLKLSGTPPCAPERNTVESFLPLEELYALFAG